MKNRTTSSTDIRSLLTSPNLLVSQEGNSRMNGGFLFGRLGLDYFATNRTTFSIGVVKVHGAFNPNDFLQTDSTYDGGPYVSYSERNTKTHREFNAYGFTGGFKYLFQKREKNLQPTQMYFQARTITIHYTTPIFILQAAVKKPEIYNSRSLAMELINL